MWASGHIAPTPATAFDGGAIKANAHPHIFAIIAQFSSLQG